MVSPTQFQQPGSPLNSNSSNTNALQPHSESPVRRTVVVVLVLAFVGGAFAYFFPKDKEDTTQLHSSANETTQSVPKSTETPVVPSVDENVPVYDESAEYDYEWGSSAFNTGYNTFTDLEFGFSIDYPTTWDFDPTVDTAGMVISFGGYENIAGIDRYGAASVALLSVSPDMTVDEYDQGSDDLLLSDPSFSLIGRGVQNLGVYDGRFIVGTYDFSDGIGNVFVSVVAVNNGVAYTFNGLFEYGDDAHFDLVFDKMSVFLNTMMASFVINKTPDLSTYDGGSSDSSLGGVMLNDLFELRSKFEEIRYGALKR